MLKISVLCISDRSAAGEREDLSGPLISELLKDIAETVYYECVPDDIDEITGELLYITDNNLASIVLTTGGTGLSPRDVTPEATLRVVEQQVPGIAEAIRANSLKHTPMAMLSRAAAGVRGKTLIINLPGSPKAVRECIEIIRPVLAHAAELLTGEQLSCGG